jgi:hypothetical protein
MVRHALADHGAVEDIERGEQGGRAMSDIIVNVGKPRASRFRPFREQLVEVGVIRDFLSVGALCEP